MYRFTLALVAMTILLPPQLARAQDWGEERRERFERLRYACEDGDERACRRLREMRREHREREGGDWGGGYGPGDRGAPPPVVAPGGGGKEAVCNAIRVNFNNCVANQQAHPAQHINCNAWPLQLRANHCL